MQKSYADKEAALNVFMDFSSVQGSNRTIYEKIVKCLRTRYLMRHNEYKKTMQAAVDVTRKTNNTRKI